MQRRFNCSEYGGGPMILQQAGDGFVQIGRPLNSEEGAKLVERLNGLVDLLENAERRHTAFLRRIKIAMENDA